MSNITFDAEHQKFIYTYSFFGIHVILFITAFISFHIVKTRFNRYKTIVKENNVNTNDIITKLLNFTETDYYRKGLKRGYIASIILLVFIISNLIILKLQYYYDKSIFFFHTYKLLLFFDFWGIIFTSLGISTLEKLNTFRSKLIDYQSSPNTINSINKNIILNDFDSIITPVVGIGYFSITLLIILLVYMYYNNFHRYYQL